MKVLALVYPGMTVQDLVGPIQAWSFLPDVQTQFVWKQAGPVLNDCGPTVHATHSLDDAWPDADVLLVPGGAKPVFDLLGDAELLAFLADRGARALGVQRMHRRLAAGRGRPAARLPCRHALGRARGAGGFRRHLEPRARVHRPQSPHRRRRDRGRGLRHRGGGALGGRAHRPVIELLIEYAPQPPYGTGRPEIADAGTLERGRALLAQAMPV